MTRLYHEVHHNTRWKDVSSVKETVLAFFFGILYYAFNRMWACCLIALLCCIMGGPIGLFFVHCILAFIAPQEKIKTLKERGYVTAEELGHMQRNNRRRQYGR